MLFILMLSLLLQGIENFEEGFRPAVILKKQDTGIIREKIFIGYPVCSDESVDNDRLNFSLDSCSTQMKFIKDAITNFSSILLNFENNVITSYQLETLARKNEELANAFMGITKNLTAIVELLQKNQINNTRIDQLESDVSLLKNQLERKETILSEVLLKLNELEARIGFNTTTTISQTAIPITPIHFGVHFFFIRTFWLYLK